MFSSSRSPVNVTVSYHWQRRCVLDFGVNNFFQVCLGSHVLSSCEGKECLKNAFRHGLGTHCEPVKLVSFSISITNELSHIPLLAKKRSGKRQERHSFLPKRLFVTAWTLTGLPFVTDFTEVCCLSLLK